MGSLILLEDNRESCILVYRHHRISDVFYRGEAGAGGGRGGGREGVEGQTRNVVNTFTLF